MPDPSEQWARELEAAEAGAGGDPSEQWASEISGERRRAKREKGVAPEGRRFAAEARARAPSLVEQVAELVTKGGGDRGRVGRRAEAIGNAIYDAMTPRGRIIGRDRRGEAGLRGLAQGTMFGFADELQGAMGALGGTDYRAARDAQRASNAEAGAQNPGLYLGGELAGSMPAMVIPGAGGATAGARIAGALGQGAALGAAEGLGRSEGETLAEWAEDAQRGALAGGALGAAGGALGEVVGAGARALQRRAPALRETADRARVLTAMGATGGTISNPKVLETITAGGRLASGRGRVSPVPGGVAEVARVMREQGLARAAGSTDELLERSGQLARESRDRIRQTLARVDELGEPVQTAPVAEGLERALVDVDPLEAVFRSDLEPAYQEMLGRLEQRMAGPGGRLTPTTMQGAQRAVTAAGNFARRSGAAQAPARQEVAAEAMDLLREQMDEAVGRAAARSSRGAETGYHEAAGSGDAARDAIAEYQRQRRLNHVMRILEDAAATSTGRALKNNALGLMDTQAAQAGAAMLGPAGGAAVALGRRALSGGRAASLRATRAEWIAGLAANAPERLGRYAEVIRRAAAAGPGRLAAVDYALSQRDPEYRALSAQTEETAP